MRSLCGDIRLHGYAQGRQQQQRNDSAAGVAQPHGGAGGRAFQSYIGLEQLVTRGSPARLTGKITK